MRPAFRTRKLSNCQVRPEQPPMKLSVSSKLNVRCLNPTPVSKLNVRFKTQRPLQNSTSVSFKLNVRSNRPSGDSNFCHRKIRRASLCPLLHHRRPYITKAKLSSSRSMTGREHPAISTRPAASMAACAETP